MTQRNPMNDRYTADGRKGQTRKSAASARPKSKAASSVRVQSTVKTKAEIKAEQKAARAKQQELDRKYYNPPTARFKKLTRLWWALLASAIIFTVLSWVLRPYIGEIPCFVVLGLAYAAIIAAFYVDLGLRRKERRRYQEQMEAHKSKEARAAEKAQKAQARAQKAEAQQKYDEAKAAEAAKPKRRGLFGSGFSLANREQIKAERAAAKAEKAAAADAEYQAKKAASDQVASDSTSK